MLQVRINLKRNQADRNDDSNMCIAIFEAQKRLHPCRAMDERLEVSEGSTTRKGVNLEWDTTCDPVERKRALVRLRALELDS
jgi:hypothetical protein